MMEGVSSSLCRITEKKEWIIVLCFFFSFCFIFQLAETKSGKAYAILVGVRTSLKFFSAGPVFKTLHVLSSPNLHGC